MITRETLEKWRAEARSLEHPQAHPDVPRPGGYEASQRMLALIAEIDRLRETIRKAVAIATAVDVEHGHRTEDTSLVVSELADKILDALRD